MQRIFIALLVALAITFAFMRAAAGDTPVMQAAHDALRTGDFSLVVVWVEPADEPALLAEFRRARGLRAMWPGADTAFLATVERMHRARVGVDGDREAAVALALATGDDEMLVETIVAQIREGLRKRTRDVTALRTHRRGDIEAGRAAVASYVDLVQYVTAVARAASLPPPPRVTPIRHER